MDQEGYLDSIYARRAESTMVDFRDVTYRDGTKPIITRCHTNVDRWVLENPNYQTVRGWLVISSDAFHGLLCSHSVVRSPDHRFIDITPIESDQRRVPFLAHVGSLDCYEPYLATPFASFTWPQEWVQATDLGG